jgi:hypothetical protein
MCYYFVIMFLFITIFARLKIKFQMQATTFNWYIVLVSSRYRLLTSFVATCTLQIEAATGAPKTAAFEPKAKLAHATNFPPAAPNQGSPRSPGTVEQPLPTLFAVA